MSSPTHKQIEVTPVKQPGLGTTNPGDKGPVSGGSQSTPEAVARKTGQPARRGDGEQRAELPIYSY